MNNIEKNSEAKFILTNVNKNYTLFILLLIAVFNYADRFMIGILIPDIKKDLDLSDTQIGFISGAAFTILYAFLGIPIARLADKYSRKKIIAIALAIWSLMTALCGTAKSFTQFAIYRVLVGIGEAGCTPPSHSIISDYYPKEERTSALAIYGLGSPIGVFIGFLVGGWIVEEYGWRIALFSFGAPGILIAIITYFTLREPPRGLSDKNKNYIKTDYNTFESFKVLWKRNTFKYMVLGGSMYGLILVSTLIWIPSFFERSHGLGPAEIGRWLAFTNGIPHALGTLAGGFLADRVIKKGVHAPILICVFAQLTAAPFYAFVLLWPNHFGAFLWFIIPSFVGVMQGPILYATIQAVSEVNQRAVAAALMILIINLFAGVIGPQIVGTTSDIISSSLGKDSLGIALLTVTTVFSLLSALFFYLASKHIKKDLDSISRI